VPFPLRQFYERRSRRSADITSSRRPDAALRRSLIRRAPRTAGHRDAVSAKTRGAPSSARSAPLDLLKQALEFGLGLAGERRGIDLVDIHRIADDDDSHKCPTPRAACRRSRRRGFGEGDGGVLAHPGIERRGSRGDHAGNGVDFMPLVGGDEGYRIAGSDSHELRVEYEETARPAG